MATNKKSFVAYCEWIESFEELSNEEAGKLVKHLFRYVNDLEPENPDRLTKMCFIPIKQQLKRDLKKYDAYINKQVENGKLGGRPKKDKVKNETQITQPFISKPKKAEDVDVDVDVDVNDNVNVINKKKNIKKEVLVYPFNSIEFKQSIKTWKQYKLDQHNFKFKSLASEQAMLKGISKDYNNETEAIEAIEYSMANGYKGIFKPQKNTKNANNEKDQYGSLKRDILSRFS